LIILVVVEIGIMRLDTLQEQITSLLEEWIDGEIKSIKRGIGRDIDGITFDVRNRSWERYFGRLWCCRILVDISSEEVRVMNDNRKF